MGVLGFFVLYFSIILTILYCKSNIMKIIKLILKVVWTVSLQNLCLWALAGWKWLWSLTTVDEQAIAAAKEVGRRTKNAVNEMDDVVDAIKGKKFNKNGSPKKKK